MKICDELKGAKNVAITGHLRPDGDCIGSTLGLYNYIKDNYPDIDVTLYLEEYGEEFSYLSRIDEIVSIPDTEKKYDVFFVLDCGDKERFPKFVKCFENAAKTICIDHHVSNNDFADVNLVVPDASSACEVLYSTLEEDKINKSVAECLYTGIIHDTGVFKYSCTGESTMTIAGRLMSKGIDYSSIIDNSFYSKTYIQNQILGRALLESVLFYEGKCIFTVVTLKEMEFYGITSKELGGAGVVEQLRLTEGVEVAIFMYEIEKGKYKCSLRSKNEVDVNRIANEFGGGGHVRAAGFSCEGIVYNIINRIGELVEEQLSI